MALFRELNDAELNDLSDDALIEYVIAARQAGREDAAKLAIQILAFGYMGVVERRVRLRMQGLAESDRELVAGAVLFSALASAFGGASVGEFRAWIHRITDRRIADFHRRPRPRPAPLPEEHESEEEIWGETLFVPDGTGAVDTWSVVEQALDELSETHRGVVELCRFSGYSAREAADIVNERFGDRLSTAIKEPNVHKIASRFEHRLRDLLHDEAEDACGRDTHHEDARSHE